MEITVRNFNDLQCCLASKSYILGLGYKQRFYRVYPVVINDISILQVDLVKYDIVFDGMPSIKQVINLIEEYLPNIFDEFDIIIEEADKKLVIIKYLVILSVLKKLNISIIKIALKGEIYCNIKTRPRVISP